MAARKSPTPARKTNQAKPSGAQPVVETPVEEKPKYEHHITHIENVKKLHGLVVTMFESRIYRIKGKPAHISGGPQSLNDMAIAFAEKLAQRKYDEALAEVRVIKPDTQGFMGVGGIEVEHPIFVEECESMVRDCKLQDKLNANAGRDMYQWPDNMKLAAIGICRMLEKRALIADLEAD